MHRRTVPAAGLVVGLLLAAGVAAAPAAQAHDELVGTDPADGTTVPFAPATVTLSFAEPAVALGTEVKVTSPAGKVVSVGEPELVDSTVRQAVDGELPAGKYTVTYRVTSQDGHAVSGKFSFTAADEAGAEEPTSPAKPVTPPPFTSSATPDPTATATASAAADPADETDADSPPALLVVGAGLLVGIVFGVLGWARARRRRSSGGHDRP